MKLITSKDGDLLSCFDNLKENNIDNTSLKQVFINNHVIEGRKRKIEGYLELEHIFGFCETFKKLLKTKDFI